MKKSDYSMEGIRKAIRELVESQKKTDEQQKKNAEQQKKTDEQQKKNAEEHKKTEELVRKTTKAVAELTDGWGMFVEGLVAPSIPKTFKVLGFDITRHGVRVKSRVGSRSIEIDVIAAGTRNGRKPVVIATSVKSRLQIDDVKDHIGNLDEFFRFYPEYRGSELMGVVAGIRLDEGVVSYAQKQGLYVIGSSGEAVELLTKKGFKPRIWKQDGRRRRR